MSQFPNRACVVLHFGDGTMCVHMTEHDIRKAIASLQAAVHELHPENDSAEGLDPFTPPYPAAQS